MIDVVVRAIYYAVLKNKPGEIKDIPACRRLIVAKLRASAKHTLGDSTPADERETLKELLKMLGETK